MRAILKICAKGKDVQNDIFHAAAFILTKFSQKVKNELNKINSANTGGWSLRPFDKNGNATRSL
jgi:hypothetical protein